MAGEELAAAYGRLAPYLPEWKKWEKFILVTWWAFLSDIRRMLDNPTVKLAAFVLAVIILAFVGITAAR